MDTKQTTTWHCGNCQHFDLSDFVDPCASCRGGSCWTPIVVTKAVEQTPFGYQPVESKPTNPKDAIGISKAPMSTVSAPVLAEVGVAMLEGAAKYGRHNYRVVGVRASVYYDATLRHLFSWWEGEDTDPDSGMSHITKAITSLVVLRDAMIQGTCTDDRAPRSAEFYAELNKKAAAILAKHADKSPQHYTIADTPKGQNDA